MESVAEYVQQGYEYIGAVQQAGRMEIRLSWAEVAVCCSACGCTRVHSHGWRKRRLSHVPLGVRPADLIVSFRRSRCQGCGRVSSPELPRIARRERMSSGLRQFLCFGVVVLQATIKRLSDWLGLGWHSVLRCLGNPPDPLAVASSAELAHLCLDEVFFCQPARFMTVLSCASGHVLGLAKGRGSRPSKELLNSLPPAVLEQVETLASDFNLGQRQAALACLPFAEVCADHFHLVRLCRQLLRAASEPARPLLREAISQLRTILKGRDPDALSLWLRNWKSQGSKGLRTLHQTVERWQPEIESAISTRRSTGPAEALNRRIALLRRLACGYTNQSNFVQRVLWLNYSPHHQE